MPFSPSGVDLPYTYVTTTGRRTGVPREIEIWFALSDDGGSVYVMSGSPGRAQWVRNLRASPAVRVRIGDHKAAGRAEFLDPAEPEYAEARERLVRKYATAEQPLEGWRATGLPVALRV